jgi:hypothetical protein
MSSLFLRQTELVGEFGNDLLEGPQLSVTQVAQQGQHRRLVVWNSHSAAS